MVCPYCRGTVDEGTGAKLCEGCNTPHHQECYDENGGCTLFGCKFAPPDEPKIQVTNNEAAVFGPPGAPQFPQFTPVPQRPATGFGDVGSGWRLSPPTAVATPQRTGTVPPPPRVIPTPWPQPAVTSAQPATQAPAPPASSNGSAARSGYVTPGGIFDTPKRATRQQGRKSRLAFILLGIFLGAFGAHNFYAGFYKRAVAQLCLTLLTVFYGSVVTWIWALVEVCTVDRDARRVEFA
jgi:TM2 domain-containing membrane protein YozV